MQWVFMHGKHVRIKRPATIEGMAMSSSAEMQTPI